MPHEAAIERRIREGLAKASARGNGVRGIYLTEPDQRALDAATSRRWGKGARAVATSFGDHLIISDKVMFDGHPIRPGKHSMIYDRSGVGFSIPKPPRPTKRGKTTKGESNGKNQVRQNC